MRASIDHIATSHVGSLPRPDALIAAHRAHEAGEPVDERAFEQTLREAVSEVVRRQHDIGIDIPGDGEFGKPMSTRVQYGSWWRYSWARLGGLEFFAEPSAFDTTPRRSHPGQVVLTSFGDRRDRSHFAAAYADPESGITTGPRAPAPRCVAPITYTGHEAIAADIANFKAAMQAAGVEQGFMSCRRPRQCRAHRQRLLQDRRGTPVRLRRRDAPRIQGHRRRRPDLADRRSGDRRELGHDQPRPNGAEYRRFAMQRVEALNHAIKRSAAGSHPLPFVLGKLARPAHDRHPDARHHRRHAGDQRERLFVRGRQRAPRARMEGLAGREAAGPQADAAGRRQPRDQRGRASGTGRRAHRSLRQSSSAGNA